jgi:hypothetical protein
MLGRLCARWSTLEGSRRVVIVTCCVYMMKMLVLANIVCDLANVLGYGAEY